MPNSSVHLPDVTNYVAYGDSITYGLKLQDPAISGYPALLAAATGLPVSNEGVGDDMSCDMPVRIFHYAATAESPSLAEPHLYSVVISTNDLSQRGTGAYESVFSLCHQAALSWLGLPSEFKTLSTSALVTTTGAHHLETATNWNDLVTDALNASIIFPVHLSSAGAVYAWYRITDGNTGAFTCALDGKIIASAASSTSPAMATLNFTTSSLALLRLPAIAAGDHTLTFTQTSTGASGMGIVAVGVPLAVPPAGMPRVLVGTTPRQRVGGGTPCSISFAPCLLYIADITNNVNLLRADGLNVTLFNSATHMTGTGSDMADSLHPNPIGHQELLHAMVDVLP